MGKYMNIFKASAAGGAGFMAGTTPQLLIGVIIFVIGFSIYQKEKKKSNSSDSKRGFALILMLLGSVLGYGIGFGTGLNSLKNEL